MNLPFEFIRNIERGFGNAGKQFLVNLPALIEEASQRWGLTDVQPSPTLSYNFVAFASRGEEQVVLKLGVPNDEMRSEIAALRLFNGEAHCRLIDYDEEKSWMLLERLKPGVCYPGDDEEATHIAGVMQKDLALRLRGGYPPPRIFYYRLVRWVERLRSG
jgi:streptomycin 6-kinase